MQPPPPFVIGQIMQQKRDLAIVLRSIPFEERHRIVTALTENHGQISGLARNSIQSRRFGGTLDLFTASEWHFVEKPGAELVRLDEALIKRSFEGIRKDFERLSLASVFSEFMIRVAPKNESCSDLFKLHSNALAALEEINTGEQSKSEDLLSSGILLKLLNGYLAKLLQWSGNQPQLQRCHDCQKPLYEMDDDSELTVLITDAAWMCPSCRSQGTKHIRGQEGFQAAQLRISPLAIIDFLMSLVSPIRQIPTHSRASLEDHRKLFLFIEALFAFHLQGFDKKPMNGLRFLGLESNLLLPATNSR
jgi:DNA repair protein RecO